MSSILSARRRRALVAGLATLAGGLAVVVTQGAQAAPPAAFTGTNSADPGSGPCLNGPGDVNCNIYGAKRDVWLNAGPLGESGAFGPGTYFWVVLEPGGGVNDTDSGNLSDDVDPYTNRTFTIAADGTATYTGTHDLAGDGTPNMKVRLGLAAAYFADTTNPGGEYRIAICALPADGTQPVGSNACKRDNFKIDRGGPGGPGDATAGEPLSVTKNATALYDESFAWDVAKTAGTASAVVGESVTYTATATYTGPTRTRFRLTGELEVSNPNDFPVALTSFADVATIGTAELPCAITTSDTVPVAVTAPPTVAPGETVFLYSCNVASATDGTNRVTIAWGGTTVGDVVLDAGDAADAVPFAFDLDAQLDECIAVGDTFNGGPAVDQQATLCADGTSTSTAYTHTAPTFTTTYTRTMPSVGTNRCATVGNTFAGVTNDTATADSASASVEVCARVTGGRTIGFWQNRNGQGLITGAGVVPTTTTCTLTPTLRGYAPFQDLAAGATCAQVATYVTNVIKAANASGSSMNAMLKAQMLATALSVEFTRTARANSFLPQVNLGGVKINTSKVCKDISACTVNENTNTAFGVTPPTYKTVADLLAYASSVPQYVSATSWYGQVKATQELAKDTFDAINNQVAVVAP